MLCITLEARMDAIVKIDQVAKPKEEAKKQATLDDLFDKFRKETQKKPVKSSAMGVRG
jgi:hypothetical protein